MPKRKQRKQKVSKKLLITFVILLILLIVTLAVFYYLAPEQFKKLFGIDDGVTAGPGSVVQGDFVNLSDGDCSVHFLELGNDKAGDCILIKVGSNEVLIDAGSRSNSIDTISSYIDKYCTDGVLEYVIATHAHEDHIACFGGSGGAEYRTIFDRYQCNTIIDFPLTNSTTKLYQRYIAERDAEVEKGAKHYTALECWNNQNGAQRQYDLGSGVTLNILYNVYYVEETDNENNYSVCTMLEDGETKYLLTGDLEGEGEILLAENNDLSGVDVLKAGHHGSKTSSTDELLNEARPSIVIITAVMGATEYTNNLDNVFPTLLACKNIARYTTNVYITSIINSAGDGAESYNGNIVIVSNDSGISMICSGSTNKIADSDWYKTHRASYI